jgi:hypothetical protein
MSTKSQLHQRPTSSHPTTGCNCALTSYNTPNALPGTLDFNGSAPATSSFVPLLPATNTVGFGGGDGTSPLLPVSGGA